MSQQQTADDYTRDGELLYSGWTDALLDGVLLGLDCDDCGNTTGTPKSACPRCGNRELDAVELPKTGEVYSETSINVPPEGFEDGYEIAIVEIGDARVLGRMEDGVEIGDTVEFVRGEELRDEPAPVFEKK